MKKTMLICLMTICLLQNGKAQVKSWLNDACGSVPYPVEVGWNPTTVLVFPSAVVSIDRGSHHILAERDRKASNILKLKAGRRGFAESNLHVVTEDGSLYHFKVNYGKKPAHLTLDVGKQIEAEKQQVLFKGMCLNPAEVSDYAQLLSTKEAFLKRKTSDHGMRLQLKGAYIVEDVLFFQLEISNLSRIDYLLEQMRFTVQDRKASKRTAIRQDAKQPLYTFFKEGKGVAGRSINTLVVAFKKFTVADKKELRIQLLEKSGDRNLLLRVRGKDILQARPLLYINP